MSTTPISYANDPNDALFFKTLKRRVAEHLKDSKLPRTAGWPMLLKTASILATFAASYGLLLSNHVKSGIGQGLLIVIYHYAMFQMTIGIAHDATHGAYAGKPRVDALISRLFDLVGIDSRYWIQTHVHSHHAAPNVPNVDSAIESFSLVRFSKKAPRAWFHRFQHIYIFAIYALVTIFQVFFLELFALRGDLYGFRRGSRSLEMQRMAGVVAKKLFVFAYSIVIPVLVVDAPVWRILLSCLIGHALCGLSIALIFQTTHLSDRTSYPEPDETGRLPTSYVRHVLETTADVAPQNRLYTWLAGGLNIHVAHHLFPHVSQTHLPALAEIVERTSYEFGMPYAKYDLRGALRSHVTLLARLGHNKTSIFACDRLVTDRVPQSSTHS